MCESITAASILPVNPGHFMNGEDREAGDLAVDSVPAPLPPIMVHWVKKVKSISEFKTLRKCCKLEQLLPLFMHLLKFSPGWGRGNGNKIVKYPSPGCS